MSARASTASVTCCRPWRRRKAAKAKQAQASESNAVTLWVDRVSDDRVLAKAAVARPRR